MSTHCEKADEQDSSQSWKVVSSVESVELVFMLVKFAIGSFLSLVVCGNL